MSDRFATVEVLARRLEQLAAGDPDATRLVYAIVIALLVIGLLLVVLATWMIRRTKADLELLGPLERMGDSKWRKRDEAGRRALLDEVRPAGALPPTWPEPENDDVGTELPPPVAPPVEPEPVAPEPDALELVEPEPVAPAPEPAVPEPVEPEPVEPAPEPDALELVEPEPVAPAPEPAVPEPVEPDPVEPDPVEPTPESSDDATDHTTSER